MPRLICAATLVTLAAMAAKNPQLDQVRNVYFLPMTSSLDQYLATRVTQAGLFQVVTDPQKADAIFTDKIGEAFEQKFDALYPPPEKEVKDDDENKDALASAKPYQRFGSFSKGRGNVFLVDRQSRNVVWSMYNPAKSARPDDLNRRAWEIMDQLRKDLKAKK